MIFIIRFQRMLQWPKLHFVHFKSFHFHFISSLLDNNNNLTKKKCEWGKEIGKIWQKILLVLEKGGKKRKDKEKKSAWKGVVSKRDGVCGVSLLILFLRGRKDSHIYRLFFFLGFCFNYFIFFSLFNLCFFSCLWSLLFL